MVVDLTPRQPAKAYGGEGGAYYEWSPAELPMLGVASIGATKLSLAARRQTRLGIALDCARALEFLHEHTSPTVIHRDSNCSIVLLDHNYRARVSDLGTTKVHHNCRNVLLDHIHAGQKE